MKPAVPAIDRPNSNATLYTPEMLALAVSLAQSPFNQAHPFQAEARSRVCGSIVAVSLAQDEAGRIAEAGIRVSACAIGQAAAAIFAQGAAGRDIAALEGSRAAIRDWLSGEGVQPHWPELEILSAAIAHKGRHAAILLPWDAAITALSNPQA